MDFRSARHYISSYQDTLGLELVNIMDKTLVFIDNARRADYRRLRQWWLSLLLRLKQRRAARKDLAILRNFSDAELKDIGLSRIDLMSIETGEILRDSSRSRR